LQFRLRHFKPVVGLELGLKDPVSGLNMGETAEVLAKEFSITRDQQDTFAMHSHLKATMAQEKCFFSGEIAPVEKRDGEPCTKDNGPRAHQSLEQLARLRPLFAQTSIDRNGTVTAGNSCPLTDGAAALVLVSADHVSRFATSPLGYITSYAIAGCDPRRMGLGPVYAVAKLLKQTGSRISDFDAIEINEAFAAQVLACQAASASTSFAQKELGLSTPLGEFPTDRLNVHGGAIALGHPVGTTGTRLILTLLRTLHLTGGRRGLATLCVGGGQGFAVTVETSKE
jgi:acetyl-CoA acetyltransferase family protein